MCTQTIKICWKNILYEEKIKKVWIFDDIELEIVTLSDNSLEVIAEMDSYLN